MIKEVVQYKEKPRPYCSGFSVCSTRDAGLFSQPRWSIVKLVSPYKTSIAYVQHTVKGSVWLSQTFT